MAMLFCAHISKRSETPESLCSKAEDLTLKAADLVEKGLYEEAYTALEGAGGFGPSLLMRRRLLMSRPKLFRDGMTGESELLQLAQSPLRREAGDAFTRRIVQSAEASATSVWLAAYWLDLVARDRTRAVGLYREASGRGCVFATDCLGWSYFTGNGVPVNYDEAARLSRSASDAGDSQARNNFAWGFYRGMGLPVDAARAVQLFRQSADEGNALATCNLGYCCEMGTGTPRDVAEARKLYSRAAARGLPEALFNLALFECKGTAAVAPDMRSAAKLLKQASNQGYRDAEQQFRRFQARGPMVPRNTADPSH